MRVNDTEVRFSSTIHSTVYVSARPHMLSCAALTVRGRARVRTDRVQPVMSIPAVSMLIGVPVMKGTSNSAHTFVLMSGLEHSFAPTLARPSLAFSLTSSVCRACSAQLRAQEVGAGDGRAAEVGVDAVCAAERRPAQVRLDEVRLGGLGAGKVAPRRERLAKVRLAEEGVDEPRVGEVGA